MRRSRVMRSPLLACVLLSCAASPARVPASSPRGALTALGWIRGRWCGPQGSGTFCERWREGPDGSFVGEGEFVREGARVSGEALRIEARADGVFYVATPEGEPATAFRLTRITADEAVFENPQHDFPTRITYRRHGGDGLEAWVEGGARRVRFSLTRAESAEDAVDPRDGCSSI